MTRALAKTHEQPFFVNLWLEAPLADTVDFAPGST